MAKDIFSLLRFKQLETIGVVFEQIVSPVALYMITIPLGYDSF